MQCIVCMFFGEGVLASHSCYVKFLDALANNQVTLCPGRPNQRGRRLAQYGLLSIYFLLFKLLLGTTSKN